MEAASGASTAPKLISLYELEKNEKATVAHRLVLEKTVEAAKNAFNGACRNRGSHLVNGEVPRQYLDKIQACQAERTKVICELMAAIRECEKASKTVERAKKEETTLQKKSWKDLLFEGKDDSITDPADEIIRYDMSRFSVEEILAGVEAIEEGEREDVVQHTKKLIRPGTKSYEIRYFLEKVAAIPRKERGDMVQWVLFMGPEIADLQRMMFLGEILASADSIDRADRGNVIGHAKKLIGVGTQSYEIEIFFQRIKAIREKERGEIVQSVLSLSPLEYKGDRSAVLAVVLKWMGLVVARERKDIIEHTKKLIRSETKDYRIEEFLQKVGLIRRENRGDIVELILLMGPEMNDWQRNNTLQQLLEWIKTIAKKDRSDVVAHAKTLVRVGTKDEEIKCFLDGIKVIPKVDRADIVQWVLAMSPNECKLERGTVFNIIFEWVNRVEEGKNMQEERGNIIGHAKRLVHPAIKAPQMKALLDEIGAMPLEERAGFVQMREDELKADHEALGRGGDSVAAEPRSGVVKSLLGWVCRS